MVKSKKKKLNKKSKRSYILASDTKYTGLGRFRPVKYNMVRSVVRGGLRPRSNALGRPRNIHFTATLQRPAATTLSL